MAPPKNGHFFLQADGPYIHSCFNLATTATPRPLKRVLAAKMRRFSKKTETSLDDCARRTNMVKLEQIQAISRALQ